MIDRVREAADRMYLKGEINPRKSCVQSRCSLGSSRCFIYCLVVYVVYVDPAAVVTAAVSPVRLGARQFDVRGVIFGETFE